MNLFIIEKMVVKKMIIGITGGIASGKSTVSQYLKDKGYFIVDADKLAYDALTIDQSCIEACLKQFDCKDKNGKIDRRRLGAIIFNNKQKQKDLENIVHPYVIKRMKEEINLHDNELMFLDIPLLYESHLEYLCDYILVIYVDEKTQLERLKKRNQFNDEEAYARIHAQMSMEIKKEKANYVIDNRGLENELYAQVENFLNDLRKGEVIWQNC